MFNRILIISVLMISLIAGCKKDEIDLPVEPKITFNSISPSSPHQYTDPVIINIGYEDGDGDLGENTDEVKNCFVTDSRLGITYKYRIQQLSPSSVAIKGTLNVELGGQVFTDSSATQSVYYIVYVTDRAGHRSNEITTSSIVLRR